MRLIWECGLCGLAIKLQGYTHYEHGNRMHICEACNKEVHDGPT